MLTNELMAKIRRIELRTKHLVNDSFAGEYHSVFKGRGMEFDEVRPYLPGDEIRTIDWNVTARMNQPYVKRYVESRELTVMIVVDASGSGDFGSVHRFKREVAAELAAVLAFAAANNNDRVGLLIFTDRAELYIPPRKGRRHILRMIRELLAFEPAGRGTDIALALDTVTRLCKRRSIVFLVSDFQTPADDYRRPLSLANRRHDVIAVDLHDPLEMEMANVGLLTLEDAETGELLWVDTGDRNWRAAFNVNVTNHEQAKLDVLRKSGVDRIAVDTEHDYVDALTRFFQMRVGRKRRH
ncbi:MAG: DUF58 domain-containing protein [Caldilinea sp.]